MSLYGSLFRRALYPLYEGRLCRRRALQYLGGIEKTQWLPREDIERRQCGGPHLMLGHAHREVPHSWMRSTRPGA